VFANALHGGVMVRVVVFSDDYRFHAANDLTDLLIVTGANLAVLLECALSQADDPAAAARVAAEKGRASIGTIGVR
jgi:mannose/fructose-specific phosphotransferase system component IIA